MSCEFAFDGGAYVLGALSPAERSAYEQHLAACPPCRDAVASIAVLPGLLARLAPFEAQQPMTAADRLPRLTKAVVTQRKRDRIKRRVLVGAAASAVCLAMLGGYVVGILREPAGSITYSTPPMSSMSTLIPGALVTAEVGFIELPRGVEVVMHCYYPDYSDRSYTFRLVAFGSDGSSEQLGSWIAGPGDHVTISGSSRFRLADLVRVELHARDGTPVLAYDLP